MKRFLRGGTILWVVFRYGLDGLLLTASKSRGCGFCRAFFRSGAT